MRLQTILTFILISLAQTFVWAFPFGESKSEFKIPALTAPVVDEAQVISTRQEEMLNQLLRDFQQRGKGQITVLTLASLQGHSIEDVTIKITDAWKLGTEKKDDGILILIVPNERKIRIEVGQGLEGQVVQLRAGALGTQRDLSPWERMAALWTSGDLQANKERPEGLLLI